MVPLCGPLSPSSTRITITLKMGHSLFKEQEKRAPRSTGFSSAPCGEILICSVSFLFATSLPLPVWSLTLLLTPSPGSQPGPSRNGMEGGRHQERIQAEVPAMPATCPDPQKLPWMLPPLIRNRILPSLPMAACQGPLQMLWSQSASARSHHQITSVLLQSPHFGQP